MLTCTWWTCSMEKSLLKQALSMGMDEGWIIRLLPGGDPPPWRALSRESSVPLEVWLTESHKKDLTVMIYYIIIIIIIINSNRDYNTGKYILSPSCYLWMSLRWGPVEWSQPVELPSFWASVQPAAQGPPLVGHPELWNTEAKGQRLVWKTPKS